MLSRHNLGPHTFLPALAPLHQLPEPFRTVSVACEQLAPRYHGEALDCRPWLEELFATPLPEWDGALERADRGLLENLMTKLSLLGHAYRWQRMPTIPENYNLQAVTLPSGLDCLWSGVAARLSVPRVGLFYTMVCNNWKLRGVEPGSAYCTEHFHDSRLDLVHSWLLPPEHEELRTFVVSALTIEARGARVLDEIKEIYDCVARDDAQEAAYHLMMLAAAILALSAAFNRAIKVARIKPGNFLKLVQPTMVWLIDGLEGASGPQSCTIQALDSFFGVSRSSPLGELLLESRRYQMPEHRALLECLDQDSGLLRDFVLESGHVRLLEAYNRCLDLMSAFRVSHQQRGKLYIGADQEDDHYVSTGLLVQQGQSKLEVFEQSMDGHIEATREERVVNAWAGRERSLEYLFRFLTEQQRALLQSHVEKIHLRAGEKIFSQGDLFPGLFVLKSGRATVTTRVGSQESVVNSISVDEVFGEMSLVDNLPASASIVAETDVEVWQLSLETVYDFLASNREAEGAFYLAVAQFVSHRLRSR